MNVDTTGPSPEEDEDILRVSICVYSDYDSEIHRDSFIINHYIPEIIEYMDEDTRTNKKGLLEQCLNSKLSYESCDKKLYTLIQSYLKDTDTTYFVAEDISVLERFLIKHLPRTSLLLEQNPRMDLTSVKRIMKMCHVKYATPIKSRNNLQNLSNQHKLICNMKEALRDR